MQITEQDVHWLAGLLEGEGHFRHHKTRESGTGSPKIDLKMTDADVMYKAANIMTAIAGAACNVIELEAERASYKNSYQIQVYGNRARAIMWAVVRLMGNRRRKQIWQALNNYSPKIS